MITVSLTFIVLTGPLQIAYAFHYTYDNELGAAIIELMNHFNHAINSVVYCVVGSKFRKELIVLLSFSKRRLEQTRVGLGKVKEESRSTATSINTSKNSTSDIAVNPM